MHIEELLTALADKDMYLVHERYEGQTGHYFLRNSRLLRITRRLHNVTPEQFETLKPHLRLVLDGCYGDLLETQYQLKR